MSDTNAAAAPETEPVVTPAPADETESKAKRLGWVPKEEFRGDPDRWRPADEFLKRGEDLMPLLRKDIEKLHDRSARLERDNAELRGVLVEMRDFSRTASEREYKRAKAELEAEMREAVSTADPVRHERAMAQLNAMEAERPAPKKAEEPASQTQLDPVVQSWIGENSTWFNQKNPTLQTFAIETYGELERESPGMSRSEMLAETKKRTMDKFPEKFGLNKRRDGAQTVATPGSASVAPRKSTKKGYDDLPAEAKSACDRFVKTIPGYTRDEYVKNYEWD